MGSRAHRPSGPANFFEPSGKVISRPAPVFVPSLALYAVIVIVSPSFKASRAKPVRFRVLGGYPSRDQLVTLPAASLTSRWMYIWGFVQSTLVTTPVSVMMVLESYSAAKE